MKAKAKKAPMCSMSRPTLGPHSAQARPGLGPKPGQTVLHRRRFRMPVLPMFALPFPARSMFFANHAESMPAAVSSCPASRATRKRLMELSIQFAQIGFCKNSLHKTLRKRISETPAKTNLLIWAWAEPRPTLGPVSAQSPPEELRRDNGAACQCQVFDLPLLGQRPKLKCRRIDCTVVLVGPKPEKIETRNKYHKHQAHTS